MSVSAPSSLTRRSGWAERLDEIMGRARTAEYCWGEWDCSVFTGEVIRALCGQDPLRKWRGTYHDGRGAHQIHRGDMAGFIDKVFSEAGLVRVKPKFTRLGDVAVVAGHNGDGVGVVLGAIVAVPGKPAGLARVGCGEIIKAWRVPE